MRRPLFACSVGLALALFAAGCDSGPTDPNLGPDGQIIPTTCVESNTAALQVGQSVSFLGPYARFFCLKGEGETQLDYVITVHAAGTASIPYLAEVNGSVAPRSFPSPAPALGDALEAPPEDPFHDALREREIAELSALVGEAGAPGDQPLSAPAAIPLVGETMVLNAQANSGGLSNGACEIPLHVTARVEVVSARAIVVADVANPGGGFSLNDYQRFAADFDTLISPLAESHFGPGTDIDQNGRTILFFTREVNRLTPRSSNSFTAGFFYARDLFPRLPSADRRFSGCTHSNEAEILYLMVPDPNGTINGNVRTRNEVDQFTLSTIIHEVQHLINAGRRLHINRLSSQLWSEEPWLNEGLSHIAEELLFFRTANLSPGTNIGQGSLSLAGPLAFAALDRHQKHNFQRFFEFLARPESIGPYDASVTLASRGATWSFLRYLADRAVDDAAFLFDVVDSNTRGLANLAQVLGGTEVVFDRLSDWRVAIYSDDRVSGLETRHRDLSWNLPSIHQRLTSGSYPIRNSILSSGVALGRELDPGGASYLRFGLEPGATASVELLTNGGLPHATLRATVLRTR